MAAGVQMEIEGVDEVKRMLEQIAPDEMRNITRTSVQRLAVVVSGMLKQKVKHKTGALARSINAMRRRGEKDLFVSDVRVGKRAPYGIILEFGTRRAKPQPYIVPTVEELRPRQAEWYRETVGEILARTLKRRANRLKRGAR